MRDNKVQELHAFQKRFAFLTVSLAAPAVIMLLVVGYSNIAAGLALGGTVALLNFWSHGKTLSQAFNYTQFKAKAYVFLNYLVRYLLYFLTLAATLQRSELHFMGAVAGLLLPRLVILIFYTFKSSELKAAIKSNQE